MIATLSRTFELHGFANIETRAVEPLDRLAKGGEIDKEIYVLRRLQADDAAGDSGLGLHFDLTVPFARYVLEHGGKLEFPFRRYQIQPAWRGERPQEGRYRQFTQADIDVVGRDELPFHHDVEVMRVMVEALDALPLPNLSFQVNNRKLIQGFYRGLGIPDVTAAIRHDRQARQAAGRGGRGASWSSDAGATEEQAQRCLELATIRVSDTLVRRAGPGARRRGRAARRRARRAGGGASTAARRAVNDHVTVEANLRIARGLDYYTGTVVEIFMAGYERLKSVGGGGRYDALAERRPDDVPRRRHLLRRLPHPGPAVRRRRPRARRRKVPSAVLVALADEESRADQRGGRDRAAPPRHRHARSPRRAQKFGKQIRYAERRGIPFVWFPGRAATRSRTSAPATRSARRPRPAWTPPQTPPRRQRQ